MLVVSTLANSSVDLAFSARHRTCLSPTKWQQHNVEMFKITLEFQNRPALKAAISIDNPDLLAGRIMEQGASEQLPNA